MTVNQVNLGVTIMEVLGISEEKKNDAELMALIMIKNGFTRVEDLDGAEVDMILSSESSAKAAKDKGLCISLYHKALAKRLIAAATPEVKSQANGTTGDVVAQALLKHMDSIDKKKPKKIMISVQDGLATAKLDVSRLFHPLHSPPPLSMRVNRLWAVRAGQVRQLSTTGQLMQRGKKMRRRQTRRRLCRVRSCRCTPSYRAGTLTGRHTQQKQEGMAVRPSPEQMQIY